MSEFIDYAANLLVGTDELRIGAFADRPAANAVPAGWQYFATDTRAIYESDGASWSRVGVALIDGSDVGGDFVTSVAKDGDTGLTGDITLSEGSNVTLTQAGNDIEIASSGGGGGGSLILFDSTLSGDGAAIDTGANGIAQTAESLLLHMVLRTSEAVAISNVSVRINGDTGANYDRQVSRVTNTTVAGAIILAATEILLGVPGNSAQAGAAGAVTLVIPAYRQTTFHKAITGQVSMPDSTAANNRVENWSMRWRSTTAINQVSVTATSGNLRAGSRLTVYGLL